MNKLSTSVFILISFLFLASTATGIAPTVNLYDEDGIHFQYPKSWYLDVVQRFPDNTRISLNSATESNIEIIILPVVEKVSLLEHAQERAKNVRNAFPEGHLTESKFNLSKTNPESELFETYSIRMRDGYEPRERIHYFIETESKAIYVKMDSRINPSEEEIEAITMIKESMKQK